METPPAEGGGGSRGGKFFSHFAAQVLLRTATRKARRKSGGTVEVKTWAYQCVHCDRAPVTQEGSCSGALSAHAQTWHRAIYENVCESSLHTKMQMRDGSLVKVYSFAEALDKHITFAVEMYLDYAVLSRSTRPGHRMHATNLDPRYTPSDRVITERLIMIIDELMTEALQQLIIQQRTEVCFIATISTARRPRARAPPLELFLRTIDVAGALAHLLVRCRARDCRVNDVSCLISGSLCLCRAHGVRRRNRPFGVKITVVRGANLLSPPPGHMRLWWSGDMRRLVSM